MKGCLVDEELHRRGELFFIARGVLPQLLIEVDIRETVPSVISRWAIDIILHFLPIHLKDLLIQINHLLLILTDPEVIIPHQCNLPQLGTEPCDLLLDRVDGLVPLDLYGELLLLGHQHLNDLEVGLVPEQFHPVVDLVHGAGFPHQHQVIGIVQVLDVEVVRERVDRGVVVVVEIGQFQLERFLGDLQGLETEDQLAVGFDHVGDQLLDGGAFLLFAGGVGCID